MTNHTSMASFVLLTLASCVKGIFDYMPQFGHRILLLAAAGLTGMYMVHLLAEDYNTYQTNNRPRPKSLFGKRSILGDDPFGAGRISAASAAAAEKAAQLTSKADFDISNAISKLDLALRFDQSGCARRYVCSVATKSSKKMSRSERNVMNMLRDLTKGATPSAGQVAFKEAMKLGKTKKDPAACSKEYSNCMFSLAQMLRLVNLMT